MGPLPGNPTTDFTAPVTLRLATINGIAAGLREIGATWDPQPFALDNPPQTNGLYAWATNDGAIIYLGIGVRATGDGLAKRISFEDGAATAEYIHGHRLAITRLTKQGVRVRPYAGDVEVKEEFNGAWIREADWGDENKEHALWVAADIKANPYKQAEKFAIRLSMHLGDIGSPVNSQHKSAWAFGKSSAVGFSDTAAEMVAARLAGKLRPDVP